MPSYDPFPSLNRRLVLAQFVERSTGKVVCTATAPVAVIVAHTLARLALRHGIAVAHLGQPIQNQQCILPLGIDHSLQRHPPGRHIDHVALGIVLRRHRPLLFEHRERLCAPHQQQQRLGIVAVEPCKPLIKRPL